MSARDERQRSGQFWFRMIGLLGGLILAWASYALGRDMLWPLVCASAFSLGLLLGDES